MDNVSFGNYGKIEFNYIEARRQAERLNVVYTDLNNVLINLIIAINDLANYIESDIELSSNVILDNLLTSNINVINSCLNAQIRDYKALAEKEKTDIEELEKVVDYAVVNNTDYYQSKMQTALFGDFVYKEEVSNYSDYPQIDDMDLYNEDGSVNMEAMLKLSEYLTEMDEDISGLYMTSADGNDLSYNQCTWWVTTRASQYLGYNYKNTGNAGDYFANNTEFETGSIPLPNSIICYNNHVAYVEAVDKVNSKIYISHAGNGTDWYGISELDISGNLGSSVPQGYIYLSNSK